MLPSSAHLLRKAATYKQQAIKHNQGVPQSTVSVRPWYQEEYKNVKIKYTDLHVDGLIRFRINNCCSQQHAVCVTIASDSRVILKADFQDDSKLI